MDSMEWFRKKEEAAAFLADLWLKDDVPILVVVPKNTACIFNCCLADCLYRRWRELKMPRNGHVYLAYPWDSLIKHFEAKGWKVFDELDGTLTAR